MADEELEARLSLDASQLVNEAKKASDALDKLQKDGEQAFEGLDEAAEESTDNVEKNLRRLAETARGQQLEKLGASFRRAFDFGRDITQGLVQAGSEFEQFRVTIGTLSQSAAEAEARFQNFVEFAGRTPFELRSVVQAGITLQTFGQTTQEALKLSADLAAVFQSSGVRIEDAALAIGRAFQGDANALQTLSNRLGITRRDLVNAGAQIGDTGAIALRTASDIDALRTAIFRVAEQKNITGAVERQLQTFEGQSSLARDQVNLLSAELGENLIPTILPLVQQFTRIAESARDIDPAFKDIASSLIGFGTAAAGVVTLGIAFRGLVLAAQAAGFAVGALGGAVTLLVGTGAALNAINNQVLRNVKARDELVNVLEKESKIRRQLGDLRGRSARELRDENVTTKELNAAIADQQQRINLLRQNTALDTNERRARIAVLGRELDELREQRNALADLEKAETGATAVQDRIQARLNEKEQLAEILQQIKLSNDEEEIKISKLKEILATNKILLENGNQRRAVEREIARLQAKQSREAKQAADAAAREAKRLNNERINNLLLEIKTSKDSEQQQIGALRRILRQEVLTGDQKRRIIREVDRLQRVSDRNRESAIRKLRRLEKQRADESRRNAEREARQFASAQQRNIQARQQSIEDEISRIEDRFIKEMENLERTGASTGALIALERKRESDLQGLLKRRLDLELELLKVQSEQSTIGVESQRALALETQTVGLQIQQARDQQKKDLDDLNKQTEDRIDLLRDEKSAVDAVTSAQQQQRNVFDAATDPGQTGFSGFSIDPQESRAAFQKRVQQERSIANIQRERSRQLRRDNQRSAQTAKEIAKQSIPGAEIRDAAGPSLSPTQLRQRRDELRRQAAAERARRREKTLGTAAQFRRIVGPDGRITLTNRPSPAVPPRRPAGPGFIGPTRDQQFQNLLGTGGQIGAGFQALGAGLGGQFQQAAGILGGLGQIRPRRESPFPGRTLDPGQFRSDPLRPQPVDVQVNVTVQDSNGNDLEQTGQPKVTVGGIGSSKASVTKGMARGRGGLGP